jgi:hypothetical protein
VVARSDRREKNNISPHNQPGIKKLNKGPHERPHFFMRTANIKKGTLSDSATTVKIRIKSGKLLNQLFPLHLRFESKDENDGTDGTPEVFMWDSARGGLQ